jgi:glycosyltransferase involved in cell wall biosynthesis
MTEENYPSDPKTRSMFRKIERKTVSNASFVVFTSPGTRRLYADRYASEDDSKWQLIENGYDEDAFQSAQSVAVDSVRDGKLTILHSGVIYPKERDPTKFFQAISNLASKGILCDKDVEFRLRATGHDDYLRRQIDRMGIQKLVKLCEPVPYQEALAEMMSCAGLLLLQAASCNHQTPAKVYEYIRAGRPILALTDSAGDTAELIQNNDLGLVASLDSTKQIEWAIQNFLTEIVRKNITRPKALTESFSRRAQVGKTAQLFDQLTGDVD